MHVSGRVAKKSKMVSNLSKCQKFCILGEELSQYTYQMLKAGVDCRILRYLSDENLRLDCGVENGVHRMKIMEAAKSKQFICMFYKPNECCRNRPSSFKCGSYQCYPILYNKEKRSLNF